MSHRSSRGLCWVNFPKGLKPWKRPARKTQESRALSQLHHEVRESQHVEELLQEGEKVKKKMWNKMITFSYFINLHFDSFLL